METSQTAINEASKIVEGDLAKCDSEQLAAFRQYSVRPYLAPIVRYGKLESVVVVAKRSDEVIYWEDVEEGFNVSALAPDGKIVHHYCNQDELGLALNYWIEGRKHPPRSGAAQPVR
jgi:hypothetical protein